MSIDSKLPNSIPAQIPNPNTPKIKWSLVLAAAISCLPLASCGAKTGDSPNLVPKCPKGDIVYSYIPKQNPNEIYVQVSGGPLQVYDKSENVVQKTVGSAGGIFCRNTGDIGSRPIKEGIKELPNGPVKVAKVAALAFSNALVGNYTYESINYSGLCEDPNVDVNVIYDPKATYLSSICGQSPQQK